ncbi:MAG: tetratricopeptide repeat protein [Candidatus Omnitrophota bacterium]
MTIIKYLFSRIFILYILAAAVWLSLGGHQAWENAKLRSLNRIMPEFEPLAQEVFHGEEMSSELRKEYIQYYRILTRDFPEIRSTRGFLAYCYARAGKRQKALDMFEQAVRDNPQIFSFHYDLAVLYYHDGRYEEAVDVLERALSINPELVQIAYLDNKLFMQILSGVLPGAVHLEVRVVDAYLDAAVLNARCLLRLERFLPALRQLQEVVEEFGSQRLDALYFQAAALFEMGQSLEGLRILRSIVQTDPAFLPAYELLDDILSAKNADPQAVQEIKRRIEHLSPLRERFKSMLTPEVRLF